ncbi:hypothetical protein GCM10028801_30830 [Nocardioides maradonensis]
MSKTIDDLLAAKSGLNRFGRNVAENLAEYERAKAALNQEAKDNWDRPEWHREQAAILSERWDYGFRFDSLFPTYIEFMNVGAQDIISWRERRGLQVFWTARGGYIEESQLKTERFTLTHDTLGFHVSEFEDKLQANYAETIEELAALGMMRLDAEINRRAFNMLQAAIPSSSPYYVNATTGLTKAELDQAITDVHDALRPNNAGALPPITIAGRAKMIDQISAVVTDAAALFDPEGTAEIRQMGRLGVYRGANIVRLQNYTDENDQSYIPDNELWVFGGTVGKFAKFGGVKTKAWVENTSDYYHFRARADVGGVISHPEMARRIVSGV